MRKCVVLLAVFVFLLGMTVQPGTSEGAPEFLLRLGHVVAENTPLHQGALLFSEKIYERTNGRVNIEVFPNAVLGDNRASMEAMQFGILDFQIPNMVTVGGYTDKTKAFELPYIIRNDAAAEAIYASPLIEEAFAGLRDSDMVYVASFTEGWRQITANRSIRSPEDMRGLRIRTMDSQIHMDHFNTLGASAIPMAFSEVFTALQQGAIDAQENPYTNIFTQAFHEVQRYIIETSHVKSVTPVIMSLHTYNRLPEDLRQIVFDTAKEVAVIERQMVIEGDRRFRDAIEATGRVNIITLTPEERQAFFDAAQPVYVTWSSELGADFIQRILDLQVGLY
jgi:tripartite ATP-independent transporter DctP family solute receptor